MKTQSIIVATLVILLVAGAFGVVFFVPTSRVETPLPTQVGNFDECVKAGNPVMESYPRQCASGGVTYVEALSAPASTTASVGSTSRTLADTIIVDTPLPYATVTSPLTVTGRARGTWYFEASFPVNLIDDQGVVLAQLPAQALSDWMTEDFVPFSSTLRWATTTAKTGTLILKRDNPSGLPENDAELRIPVTF